MSTAFARTLRDRRRVLSHTQAQAAAVLRVSQQTVAAWEAGRRPSAELINVLAEYLQMDRQDLWGLLSPDDEEPDLHEEMRALRREVSEIRTLVEQVITILTQRRR